MSTCKSPFTHGFFTFLLGGCLILSGCASTYRQPGTDAQGTGIAVIEDEPCEGNNCLILQEIDGKFRGIGWFKRYELMPGKRIIKFIFKAPGVSSQGAVLVEFNAEAGHTYGVRANASSTAMRWSPVVFDKNSGQVVSKPIGAAASY